MGKIKSEWWLLFFVFVFAQLNDSDFNTQSDWEPFKFLNLGSDMIELHFCKITLDKTWRMNG